MLASISLTLIWKVWVDSYRVINLFSNRDVSFLIDLPLVHQPLYDVRLLLKNKINMRHEHTGLTMRKASTREKLLRVISPSFLLWKH